MLQDPIFMKTFHAFISVRVMLGQAVRGEITHQVEESDRVVTTISIEKNQDVFYTIYILKIVIHTVIFYELILKIIIHGGKYSMWNYEDKTVGNVWSIVYQDYQGKQSERLNYSFRLVWSKDQLPVV